MTVSDTPRRLRRLVYASTFGGRRGELSESLRTILAKSIQNNRQVDVTGKLIVGDGRFLQLLEGPAVAVEAVYARIAADPRHCDLHILSDQTADRRLYRDWNMAHHQIGASDQDRLRRFGLEAFLPARLSPEQALDLITQTGDRPAP